MSLLQFESLQRHLLAISSQYLGFPGTPMAPAQLGCPDWQWGRLQRPGQAFSTTPDEEVPPSIQNPPGHAQVSLAVRLRSMQMHTAQSCVLGSGFVRGV